MKAPALTSRELALLREVFGRHPEIQTVKLFGSRTKGTHVASSDVDLALWGDIDALRAESIAAELDELPLPYRYDVNGVTQLKLDRGLCSIGV
jgi:uncharacterized protein